MSNKYQIHNAFINQPVSKTYKQQEAASSRRKDRHKDPHYPNPKLTDNHPHLQIQMKQLQNKGQSNQNNYVQPPRKQSLESQTSDRKLAQNTFFFRKSLDDQTHQAQIHQTQQQNEQDSFENDINNLAHQLTKYAEQQADYNYDICLVGLWIGFIICILAFMLALIFIHDLSIENNSQFSRDFPVWRGLAIFIFYIWMLAFNVYIFKKYKLNLKKMFDLPDDYVPKSIDLMKLAGFLTSIYLIFFMLYLLDITDLYNAPNFAEEYFALVCWIVFALSICAPIPVYFRQGRFLLLRLFGRTLLSPFRGMTFAIFMMTDQLVSMALPLKDLSYTVCFYTQLDFSSNSSALCSDGNRASAVLVTAIVASSMRAIQCMRQGYDKGEYFKTPFFVNTCKHCAVITTALLAFQYKTAKVQILQVWLVFAGVSSFSAFLWDILMDWNILGKNQKHKYLREDLIYKPASIYYCAIVGDLVMRITWIVTLSPNLAANLNHFNLLIMLLGMVQMFRRGVWNLIRVQKQHIELLKTINPDKKIVRDVKLRKKADDIVQIKKQLYLLGNKYSNERRTTKNSLKTFLIEGKGQRQIQNQINENSLKQQFSLNDNQQYPNDQYLDKSSKQIRKVLK